MLCHQKLKEINHAFEMVAEMEMVVPPTHRQYVDSNPDIIYYRAQIKELTNKIKAMDKEKKKEILSVFEGLFKSCRFASDKINRLTYAEKEEIRKCPEYLKIIEGAKQIKLEL
jgi:hypothetical protein